MANVGVTKPLRRSDSAIANLFNAHVNSLNVEKQLIWQRYHAMLVANSIAFAFVANNLQQPEAVLAICVFGLILCILWARFVRFGWELMWNRIQYIAEFKWPGYTNPHDLPYHKVTRADPSKDRIRSAASQVIVLFGVAYFVAAVWALWRLLLP